VLIPAVIGRDSDGYASFDRQVVTGLDGSILAEATVTPPLMVHALGRRDCPALRDLPVRTLLEIFARAADLFERGAPDGLAPEAYVRNVTLTTGLPLTASRNRTLGSFPEAMRAMGRFLEAQSPAGLDLFDSNECTLAGVRLGLVPRGRNVGFVMPGNHPATHFMWLGALAMKVPVILRPSVDDLFTPYRLVRALLQAGLPDGAIAFVPGGHDLVDAVAQSCALSVLFGGQQLVDRYASDARVKVHGPGRSKVIVLADADFDDSVALIRHLVTDDAGRACINASAVIVEGDSARLATAVAAALDDLVLSSPLSPSAVLGATTPAQAAAFTTMIDRLVDDNARELSPGPERRLAMIDGMTVMRPTVIEVASFEHPLFGVELPFPFVVFASASSEDLLGAARNSLTVIVVGGDRGLARELLFEPSIDKVLAGTELSTEFDPIEPHEGYLFDFLYQKKALRRSPNALPVAIGAR
jgi:acyl-CoA reductase-like NAD-dependent aldehyde dehydrogenase